MKRILVAVVLLLMSGCSSNDITFDKAQQIRAGMTYQEVVRILGRPGERLYGDENLAGYTWHNKDWLGSNTKYYLVVSFDGNYVRRVDASQLRDYREY